MMRESQPHVHVQTSQDNSKFGVSLAERARSGRLSRKRAAKSTWDGGGLGGAPVPGQGLKLATRAR